VKVKIIQKPKLYYILWHDAHSSSGWHTKVELEKFIKEERCLVEEVGWIISETNKEIVMAARRLKWVKNGDPEWGLIQKIPKSWVKIKKIAI